ncbi:Flp pilus assembly protein TadG [Novosphingobium hassiacum]|uniref:Flp pilus assembly protein TadG n=1 Tax=Novosphingobium hassiacum TaxID=173676 RepID=A0A7W5ZVJ6_9SPHN|nr:TadE/TadG family type IV pilus assembly protein [Novosphingobium hassiacum]MBB3860736.1 Flp pilus assembly protein TadG [Novosphingobium hassiacum]
MLRKAALRGYNLCSAIARSTSGVTLVEFAVAMPVILSMSLYGIELAYLNTVDMKLSEIALSLADNASRLGQTDNSAVTPTVTRNDIAEIMMGAQEQGDPIDLGTKGRVILSSLERDATTGKQYIHWQRCYGSLARQSAYGNDSTRNGLNGAVITGMGSGATKVTATSTSGAVMFVEVYYSYTGLLGDLFVSNRVLRKEGAFLVRDERNLTPGITGTTGPTYTC